MLASHESSLSLIFSHHYVICILSCVHRSNSWTLLRQKYKSVQSFPPCYAHAHRILQIFLPPLEQKWVETGLYCKHCILKPQVWELSRFWPETSTKLYVHEWGFRPPWVILYLNVLSFLYSNTRNYNKKESPSYSIWLLQYCSNFLHPRPFLAKEGKASTCHTEGRTIAREMENEYDHNGCMLRLLEWRGGEYQLYWRQKKP
jgi:hypothetical protein